MKLCLKNAQKVILNYIFEKNTQVRTWIYTLMKIEI